VHTIDCSPLFYNLYDLQYICTGFMYNLANKYKKLCLILNVFCYFRLGTITLKQQAVTFGLKLCDAVIFTGIC